MENDPYVAVTYQGVTTRLALRRGRRIARNPITGLGQVVTTGDNAQRSDQRTPQIIFSDQSGGMGEFAYTETDGIGTFTISDCDTRYMGEIVLPPATAQLLGVVSVSTDNPVVVEHVGLPNARVVAYVRFQTTQPVAMTANMRRYVDGTGWTDVLNPTGDYGGLTGFVRYKGQFFWTALSPAGAIWYSGDMITTSKSAYVSSPGGCVVHDNKFYIWDRNTSGMAWTLDPTVATGWLTSGGKLYLQPSEQVLQLFEWRDASGRTAIYVLTTQRLMLYDEDADVFLAFYDFTEQVNLNTNPAAYVWRRDGNLYLIFDNSFDQSTRDTVIWFSGTTNQTGPNVKGGIPAGSRVGLRHMVGGLHWLYYWGASVNTYTTPGRLLAMNDQQGFHTLFTGLDINLQSVVGGGYARGTAWVVLKDATVREITLPDNTILPHLALGRTYLAGVTCNHEYAYTDGGTPNMFKQALWVTVQSLDHTSAGKVPGLAAGCQVVVQYQRDVDNAWTTIGTLTGANTFPATLPINAGNGVSFKQIKLRIGLSSTTAANTPVVTSVSLAYLRQEVPRYAYTLAVDLSDETHPYYKGVGRAQLLRRIESWAQPGAIVGLAFAGGDWAGQQRDVRTMVGNCTVAFSGEDDPDDGPQTYSLVFSDYSSPASG